MAVVAGLVIGPVLSDLFGLATKEFHWAVALDTEGEVLISRKVDNSEADLSALIDDDFRLGDGGYLGRRPTRRGCGAAAGAPVGSRPAGPLRNPASRWTGRATPTVGSPRPTPVMPASSQSWLACAKDLAALKPIDEMLAELKLLVAHRRDLVLDQARAVVRLRDVLVALFPGLESVLHLRTRGPLVLGSRYQTPSAVRRAGHGRIIEAYLKNRGVRNVSKLAEEALSAAKAQLTRKPAEGVAAEIVRDLAERALTLKERTAELDG